MGLRVGLGGLGGPRAPSHDDSHLNPSFSPWSLSLGALAFDILPLHPLSLSLSHLSLGWVLVSGVSLLVSSGRPGSLHLSAVSVSFRLYYHVSSHPSPPLSLFLSFLQPLTSPPDP